MSSEGYAAHPAVLYSSLKIKMPVWHIYFKFELAESGVLAHGRI
jgi:hypothetical protein